MPPENRIISIYLLYTDMTNNGILRKYSEALEWTYLNETNGVKTVISY